ncbi:hypothetical protein GCM10008968_34490 [Bacillus horti]
MFFSLAISFISKYCGDHAMAPQVEKEGGICMNDNLLYVLPFYPPLENRYFGFHINFKKLPQ